VTIYRTTKKHNQQKVDCKLWTDKHIKTSTKNLQFSDQNSSWKIVNLQFSHDREITCLVVFKTGSLDICRYIRVRWWVGLVGIKMIFFFLFRICNETSSSSLAGIYKYTKWCRTAHIVTLCYGTVHDRYGCLCPFCICPCLPKMFSRLLFYAQWC
jgi:hypothetical protein